MKSSVLVLMLGTLTIQVMGSGLNASGQDCTPPSVSQISTTDLKTHYEFKGNSNDVSGYTNTGLPLNGMALAADRFSVPNSAYVLNGSGSNQWMATTNSFTDPNTFTIGIWFKTTTTSGGGIMGFCDNQTSTSLISRDRAIYMNDLGQLRFGLYTGSVQTIKTNESYNDGYWHFAVASLSPGGMKLYVDGLLKAVDPSITAGQSMTGYWRLGHFNLSEGWSTASSHYFNGTLDEVYYYERELSASEIKTLYEMPYGAGSDSPKCSGETLSLKGATVSGATYSWTGPNGFTSTAQNPVVSNMSSVKEGLYYLTITDAASCATAPIPVLVRMPIVSVNISQVPTTGLITRYIFNGNSTDVSGNANTGAFQNSPSLISDRFGNAGSAYLFNGSTQYVSTATSYINPTVFSLGLWFKTTSITGGKLMGFGNSQIGASSTSDRHIYMTDGGQLIFGVNSGAFKTISTNGEIYNDGQWHFVVATLSGAGMKLYVDGNMQSSDPSVTSAQNYTGYWKVGYDNIQSTWPSAPSSNYFSGSLDDVYLYNTELSAAQITTLYKNADGAGSNDPFCTSGGILELTSPTFSTATHSYYWTGPNGFTSISQNPTISGITISNAGLYTLTVTTTSSCPAKAYTLVRIDDPPAAPVTAGASRCGTGSVVLNASGSPLKYRWYTSSSGGTSLAGTSFYTTPSLSGDVTYYVSSVNSAGCESTTRTSVTARINSIPSAPTGVDGARCEPGIVTLAATGSPSDYNWYAASIGGASLGTGSSYAPTVSATTTFYVSSVSVEGCESSTRTAVVAAINTLPSAPTATGAARCGTGIVTLTASGSPSGYNWYAASSGGISLGTGSSYAPTVSATTTFHVSSVSAEGCESSTRTEVIATVNTLPSAPTTTGAARCSTGTVTLTASGSPSGYNWYAASSGGISLGTGSSYAPTVSATTTFHVSSVSAEGCESSIRTTVIATVNPLPSAPTATGAARCSTGTVTLVASGSPSDYNWYAASSGGISLGTGSSYSPTVSAPTTTFYVSSVSAEGCESSTRTAVIATVNTLPPAPNTTGAARCSTGTVTLTASGSPSDYNWYAASSGGISLGAGSSYAPTISATTTFHVSSVSAEGCESSTRTAVIAIVNPLPSAPTTTGAARCSTGIVTLTASGSPSDYSWYAASSGGISLGTGASYAPTISATTTFHVSSVSAEGCESSIRTAVIATVNPLPSAPTATGAVRCSTGTVTLTASGSPSGYNWYAASSGGIPLGAGSSYAPTVSAPTTTFYVSSVSAEGCESSTRTAVIAIVNPLPSAPTATGAALCSTGTVTLTASGSPSDYNWYAASSGGISLGAGSSYAPTVSTTTTFYVSSVSAAGCESSTRTAVIATVNTLPPAPSTTGAARCSTGIVTLIASGSPSGYNWYAASSGGISLGSGSSYAPTVSATTTFHVSSVSAEGCESSIRTAVIATVNPLPSAPTATGAARCSTGTVTLIASGSPSNYIWYAASSGGISLGTGSSYAPTVSTTTTFYVSSVSAEGCQSSTRTAVIATVNALPAAPTATGDARCGTGTVTLTASGSPSGYSWYTASSGGASLATGSGFSPTVSADSIFYVSSVSAEACESATRTMVTAIVHTVPPAPIGNSGSRCGSGIVNLSVTGSFDYKWYSASIGGASIGTGTSLSPTVSTDSIFYVSAVSTEGCESATRTEITATIHANPLAPIGTGDSRCGPGVVMLTASGSPSSYEWYAVPSGGLSIGTGSSFSPTVSADSIFYVSATSLAGCESSRVGVSVIASSLNDDAILSGSAVVCSGANSGWLQLSNYSGVIQKWEVSLDDFAFDVNDLSNTSDQYQYNNIFETSYYRVIVKSGVCPLDTFNITVTVDLPTDAGWLSGGGIIESPDYTGSLFLMEHTGTIIRWESSTDDFATFSIINNTTNEHFYSNLNATTKYRVLVKSGVCSDALSNIVTMELPVKLVADTIQTTRSISYHPGISVLSNDIVSSSYILQSALPATTEMGGTLTMDTLGYFTYKPPIDFFGIDQYMYSVCDRATGTKCFTAPLVFNVKDTVIVYSSLTPNGDNMNDVWVIDGINSFPGNSVKILNRWGDVVFQQDNYNNQDKVWKGQCNSGIVLGASILPDGTYFYSIELGDGSGSLTGYVVIKQ